MNVKTRSGLRRFVSISLLPIFVSLALFAILLWLASVAAGAMAAATLDVCPSGCPFTAVQPAIDAAGTDDLIRVAGGKYVGTLVITKTIVLEGGYSGPSDWHRDRSANESILDGANGGSVIRITDDVSPTIDGFTIMGGKTSGAGGGIFVDNGSPVIRHNVVYSNAALYGGGIGIYRGSPILSHNTVISNSASSYGGGIYSVGRTTAPTVDGNHIIGNRASNGGGVFVDDYSLPILNNNVIARNRASSNGGGIYVDFYSEPSIVNNTIVANDLGPSYANEGIFLYNSPSPIILNNIIVTHSTAIEGTPLTITLDYNNVWACRSACYSGVVTGGHDISDDPRFVDPGAGDYHLQRGSSSIDAGTHLHAPTADFDQDVRPAGDGIDIGADEFSAYGAYLPFVLLDNASTP